MVDLCFTKSRLYRDSVVVHVHVVAFRADGSEVVLEFLANNDDHADILGEEAIQILTAAFPPPVAPPPASPAP